LLPPLIISSESSIHHIEGYIGAQAGLALPATVATFFVQSRLLLQVKKHAWQNLQAAFPGKKGALMYGRNIKMCAKKCRWQ
jgi:hypothetical protein